MTLPPRPTTRTGTTLRTLAAVLAATALASSPAPPAPTSTTRSPAATAPSTSVRDLYGSENRTLPTHRRMIALTFNAAWNTDGTRAVLRTLRRHHAPAAFFLTGDFAERHPGTARALVAAGHGIGNHSHTHPHFQNVSRERRAQEVLRADHAIRAATGTAPMPFFRFPYSETSPGTIAEVNRLGFADIEFTADTNGWKGARGGMTVRKAVGRAVAALRPGAIIQMHVGTQPGQAHDRHDRGGVIDARALPRIIEAAHARGYRIADLRTLLTPDHH
ncbi:polysaccharide deacetylase family protein [Streptomyces sp. ODS28]|uniref:polysaccharide deacetylase family protein n=1 Tax=Streptomyces sp. ODS28 TaxID=3136688 RepID=UPI0031E7F8A6